MALVGRVVSRSTALLLLLVAICPAQSVTTAHRRTLEELFVARAHAVSPDEGVLNAREPMEGSAVPAVDFSGGFHKKSVRLPVLRAEGVQHALTLGPGLFHEGSRGHRQNAASSRSMSERSVCSAIARSAVMRGRLVCAKNCAAATFPS